MYNIYPMNKLKKKIQIDRDISYNISCNLVRRCVVHSTMISFTKYYLLASKGRKLEHAVLALAQ